LLAREELVMGTHLGGNPIGPTGVQVPPGKKKEQNPHLKSMEFPGSLNKW